MDLVWQWDEVGQCCTWVENGVVYWVVDLAVPGQFGGLLQLGVGWQVELFGREVAGLIVVVGLEGPVRRVVIGQYGILQKLVVGKIAVEGQQCPAT